jgi:hypothetical protein
VIEVARGKWRTGGEGGGRVSYYAAILVFSRRVALKPRVQACTGEEGRRCVSVWVYIGLDSELGHALRSSRREV